MQSVRVQGLPGEQRQDPDSAHRGPQEETYATLLALLSYLGNLLCTMHEECNYIMIGLAVLTYGLDWIGGE